MLDEESLRKLYKCVTATMNPPANLKRYDVCRGNTYKTHLIVESLTIMAKHVSIFTDFIMKDYINLYKSLFETMQHSNKDISRLAIFAMESFLQFVINCILL